MRGGSARQLHKGRSIEVSAQDNHDCAESSDDRASFLVRRGPIPGFDAYAA